MKPTPTRGFDVLDAVILGAAATAGFALLRAGLGESFASTLRHPERIDPAVFYSRILEAGSYATAPFWMTLSPAVLVGAWRRPRPGLRALARQPGIAACLIATLILGVHVAGSAVHEMVAPPAPGLAPPLAPPSPSILQEMLSALAWHQIAAPEGYGVAGAWLALALSRRWRPAPSWIDRLGRVVGAGWIFANAVNHGYFLLVRS
jgi:hypothetical protein